MSFVLVTDKENCIIIDGGRPEDMPLLKQYVAGRHVSAWILTHAHIDHISGFVDEFVQHGGKDFDIDTIYYNFPPYDELIRKTDVEDVEWFRHDLDNMLPAFNKALPLFQDKTRIVHQGESLDIDEAICMLQNGEPVEVVYRESRHLLKSDLCQMAHHGHMNVGMEVYAAILPEACLWCCADWLYNEPEIPPYLEDAQKLRKMGRIRMYGTAVTRRWMDLLGVKKHYVTKDGTQRIEL